jgi:hypothetical protein
MGWMPGACSVPLPRREPLHVVPGYRVYGEVVTAHDDREHRVGRLVQGGGRRLGITPEERGGPVQLPGLRDDGLVDVGLERCHVT